MSLPTGSLRYLRGDGQKCCLGRSVRDDALSFRFFFACDCCICVVIIGALGRVNVLVNVRPFPLCFKLRT